VTDHFFKRVTATKRRPERVELDAVPGLQVVRTQFILAGRGKFRISVSAAHGGLLTKDEILP
jgi:hypothetical protein